MENSKTTYWQNAERTNGRMAMMGLFALVVNYGLFGWIIPGIFKMNLGLLFLKVNTLGVITLSELDWITNHQSEFSRLDMALVIKIGRLMDSGVVEIDNRLPV